MVFTKKWTADQGRAAKGHEDAFSAVWNQNEFGIPRPPDDEGTRGQCDTSTSSGIEISVNEEKISNTNEFNYHVKRPRKGIRWRR